MSEKQEILEILFPYMNKANVNMTKLSQVIGVTKTTMSKRFRKPDTFTRGELKKIGNYLNMTLEDKGRLISA